MQAMMQMRKIDIARLRQAYEEWLILDPVGLNARSHRFWLEPA
jgi:hypothetical protein